MTKRSEDPAECPDDDNPRLTRIELRKARPAREVLPGLIGEAAAKELLGEEGRKGEMGRLHPKRWTGACPEI